MVVAKVADVRADVVHNVAVTRVSRAGDTAGDGIVYQTVLERTVKSATLPALIDCLGQQDTQLGRALLNTYRSFTTPDALLKLLFEVEIIALTTFPQMTANRFTGIPAVHYGCGTCANGAVGIGNDADVLDLVPFGGRVHHFRRHLVPANGSPRAGSLAMQPGCACSAADGADGRFLTRAATCRAVRRPCHGSWQRRRRTGCRCPK